MFIGDVHYFADVFLRSIKATNTIVGKANF